MEEKLAPLICCVDEEQINLKIHKSLLKKRGCRAVSAENGVQALEVIRTTKPNLILLDIVMPEIECRHTDKNARPLGRAPPGSCTETIRDSTLRLPSV